jgi:hypothetical protein
MANYHRHDKQDSTEPKSILRKLAVPIILVITLVYAAQWAFRFSPRANPRNLAAGIAFAAFATLLWVLKPRRQR